MVEELEGLAADIGPFHDTDGSEIIPLGMEDGVESLAELIGAYRVVESDLAELRGVVVEIDGRDLTRFIQQDWDRVMQGDRPRRGFLMAYRSRAYATGRMVEEMLAAKLLVGAGVYDPNVARSVYFGDAEDEGLVRRPKGRRSDDLVLVSRGGDVVLVECKASHSEGYLKRSAPHCRRQLAASWRANPHAAGALAVLVNLTEKSVQVRAWRTMDEL